ncbi:FAD/NAD(P)-binding protein [Macrococcus brunensis]|uniref:FAD/NAD(P)-binding protein n=1 Tax=Macrococcus brunensis TaxID=198483 RepID=UPI001EF14030|nr:FAD/NAD(P)-binding protein [Macrococcus brunensis]ULG71378.1 FAD/NAD(P)-binding protein [Macrococcus brunensis]
MKVAIIGGGVAGTHVLKYLLNHKLGKKLDITVFDDKKYMGKGRAFRYEDVEMLLNYPANQLSMKRNKKDDFMKWVEENRSVEDIQAREGDNSDNEGNIYFSRQLFGKYMESLFESLVKKGKVTVVTNHIRAVKKRATGYELETQDQKYQFDHLFMASGQLPAEDPYALKETEHFIAWPYPLRTLDIDADKDYAVIGAGLSGLDCMRYFTKKGSKLLVASHSGEVQSVRGKMVTFKMKYWTAASFRKIRKKNNDFIPLDKVVELFKKECDHQGVDFEKFYGVSRKDPVKAMQFDLKNHEAIGALQSMFYQIMFEASQIWPYMTKEDKARYQEEYAPFVDHYSNPMPEPSAEELIDHIENNRVVIKAGLEAIEYKYRKYRLQYEDGSENRVHYVINATGPAKYLSKTEVSPMLEGLLNDSLIAEHADGGIQVMPGDGRVISPKYGVLDDFVALGQLTGGVNMKNNGVYELLLEARRDVKAFYDRIK